MPPSRSMSAMFLRHYLVTPAAICLVLAAVIFFGPLPARVEKHYNAVVPQGLLPISQHALELTRSLTIVDLHADSLFWRRDLTERGTRGHIDFPRLREGNVTVQVFSTVSQAPEGNDTGRRASDFDRVTPLAIAQLWPVGTWRSNVQRTLYQGARLERWSNDSRNDLSLLRTRGDLEALLRHRLDAPQALGGLLAVEGLHALDGKLENLQQLYDAGFRMMGLAHLFDNEVAGSIHGLGRGGLTSLGREVVQQMQRLGIAIDLSHASPQTIDETLALATKPLVASHTGVRGTCDNNRNLSDHALQGIAATGGVVGIGYWEAAVCGTSPRDIARAVRHAASVMGIEHVALGSDFDGAVTTAFDSSHISQVTQALIDAGFSDDEIRAVMGANALRVLREVL